MAKFVRGTSGNPKGRTPGIRDCRVAARDLFAHHRDDLIAAAINLALAGDTAALRLCIERVCPAIKPSADTVNLGTLPASAAARAEHIIQYLAAGQVSPDTANEILAAILQHGRILEASDLERRIAALEATIS